MREDNNNWERLARYLAGECSYREQRRLETWIRAEPERRELVARLRRVWKASEAPPGESPHGKLEVAADWEALVRKMRAQEAQTGRGAARGRGPAQGQGPARDRRPASRSDRSRSNRRRSASSLRQFARVAALLILLAGGAFLALELSGSPVSSEASLREIVTGPGERATVRLADGTTVTLNVDSRLGLSDAFSRGALREVYLRGEAYFDVAPDAERPFVVHAGPAVVRVEGTAFNVEAYAEARPVKVAVAEGIVMLTSGQEEGTPTVRLGRGQLGRLEGLEGGGMRVSKEEAEVAAYLAWTEGRLVFQNTPLSEVATRLERWYGVECKIGDEVPRPLHLTAVLNSRSIREVLDVITASLGLQYRIEENTVLLMRKE